MAETSPGDAKATERLHEYWVHGEGAAKIGWGQPGDFDKCVLELGKYIRDPKGYCAKAHHEATGMWPAQHAAMEHGRAAMATMTKAPYGDVTYADPGYQSDGQKRYPLDSAEHCKAAWSYINMPKNASQYSSEHLAAIKGRIKAALKKYGVTVSEDQSSSRTEDGRAESLVPVERNFPLKDLSVRSGGRDGKIVTAYAAVFDTPAPIRDDDGDYEEVIDRSAFNRAISDAAPQGNRKNWRIGVFYNHGRTLAGTPSDKHSMPIGVPLSIRADGVGVLTETQYHRSDFCEEIVEGLESGAIPGYSFSGMFRRSQPLIPRGGFRRDRSGNLPTVRRMESTLREYGPTPFPAYPEAGIVEMRAQTLLAAMASDPELATRMFGMFRDGAPMDSPPLSGAPHDGDSPAEDSHQLLVRSGRPVKEEMQAARSAFLQRHRR